MPRRPIGRMGTGNSDALFPKPIQGGPVTAVPPTVIARPPTALSAEQESQYDLMARVLREILPTVVVPVITAPFARWRAQGVIVNQAAPLRLDTPRIVGRKAILILNPTINALWIAEGDTVAVNRGLLVPANNGSITMPLRSDEAQVWGIMGAGGAGQVVCLTTFY